MQGRGVDEGGDDLGVLLGQIPVAASGRIPAIQSRVVPGEYCPYVDTAASPRVLVIGLDPYRVPGPWDPEPVAEAIKVGLTKFAEHGVGVETCLSK